MSSMIGNNASISKRNINIPKLEDIQDRFYDIDKCIKVKIDYAGYMKEINGYAPFTGYVSIKNVINILNRDINVILINETDLTKLRNSIIFYNEYFCNNEELNVFDMQPAPMAFERIEEKYIKLVGVKEKEEENNNPFINNLLDIIDPHDTSIENELDVYISKMKLENKKITSSSKTLQGNPNTSSIEENIPLHYAICSRMNRVVDFSNLEYCWEDIDFIQ